MSTSMTKRLTRTPSGFFAPNGGGWEQMPQPPQWFGTSVQVCGIYPFGAGTGRPIDGSPLGQDMITHSAVCTDHDALYRSNVISSPSAFLFGLNGNGKSSTAQTLIGGQVGRGLTPAIFDPIKGEHVPWIESLGGTVFSIGPQARHQLNLLSPGPLGYAARRIGGKVGQELLQLARAKSIDLVKLCVRINRGVDEPVMDIEETALEAIVDTILDRTGSHETAVTADLVRAFSAPSPLMLERTGQPTPEAFMARFSRLGETLRSLMTGQMGQMLSGTNSVEFEPGNPGGFCFDTSSIGSKNTKLLSAAMLSTWSLGMDAIDAHWELAMHELGLQAEAHANGDVYEPRIRWGGYTSLMDEFWYPIRACEGMVDLVDGLSRTNRSVGTAEMKVSHSPKDMLSLRNADDREKAKGLIERSGLLMLMALSREDLMELSKVRPLTPKEIDLVAKFNSSKTWRSPRRREGDKGTPPGAGKVLLKISERVGIPVKMLRTKTQMANHTTDERYQ
ncbi:ATP-binding protein (plasmid) [Clavibacter nebraskensis]|nr:ATP-binding protein [Clavibacter nebraskensis]UQB17900.1 ATP-binding protein [Clavibacter nebraskensis]